ncbi:hypothetical protein EYF80_055620 [Liparis tanakae]|uniref:Uncharacterized protein n=1 Tax=Liparis tanakae TaxID=230148 RepID=A0A4Z2EZ28_9TELE|nr:hypothetical protein EYF80_055620 [Liparis tanakae]
MRSYCAIESRAPPRSEASHAPRRRRIVAIEREGRVETSRTDARPDLAAGSSRSRQDAARRSSERTPRTSVPHRAAAAGGGNRRIFCDTSKEREEELRAAGGRPSQRRNINISDGIFGKCGRGDVFVIFLDYGNLASGA